MNVQNPILPGFNPDPSLVRAGDDYYIATSTFEWFPGVCIHHSKDLVNWEIASYVLTEETAFDIRGIDSACGIWAPNLTYDNGTFYLLYTIVYTNRHRYKDTHNFMVTARDVKGPWSKPALLNKTGFDPSLFHDVDGRKWLVNMMIDYRLDHKRFGGVLVQEFDAETKKLTGPVYNVFKGSEIGTTEGPNIFYHGGYYYLVMAEGGTEFKHCTTMCRAEKVTGPYEPCPYNPILTSFGKEDVRLKRAGHSQIILGRDGNWYMAHLCSRTLDDCSILGRETAIQNMKLTEDGWFVLSANDTGSPEDEFQVPEDVEVLPKKSGRVDFSDTDVSNGKPGVERQNGGIPLDYMTLRQSAESLGIRVEDGKLKVRGGNSLCSKYQVAYLARRQQQFNYDFTAKMEFAPRNYAETAGVACYYNYDNYYYCFLSRDDEGEECISVVSSENKEVRNSRAAVVNAEGKPVYLKAMVRERELQFYYSLDGENYEPVGDVLDMRVLSDERVDWNGFTGAMVGVTCQDLGGVGCQAEFEWIDYQEK